MERHNFMKEKRQIPEIIIPKGYQIEEYLEIDDSDFEEEPLLQEEVKITFE